MVILSDSAVQMAVLTLLDTSLRIISSALMMVSRSRRSAHSETKACVRALQFVVNNQTLFIFHGVKQISFHGNMRLHILSDHLQLLETLPSLTLGTGIQIMWTCRE